MSPAPSWKPEASDPNYTLDCDEPLFFTKRVEHRQWLRNKKQEAYVAFFEAFRAAIIHFAQRDPVMEFLPDAKAVPLVMAVRPTVIKLVPPDAIRKRAEEVYDRAMWPSSVMDFESKAQPNIEKSWHRAEALIKELEELCREDLKKA